jgi:hypothetical protein
MSRGVFGNIERRFLGDAIQVLRNSSPSVSFSASVTSASPWR